MASEEVASLITSCLTRFPTSMERLAEVDGGKPVTYNNSSRRLAFYRSPSMAALSRRAPFS